MVIKIWYFLLVYISVWNDVEGGYQSCKRQIVPNVNVCSSKSLSGSTVYLSSTIVENNGLDGNAPGCRCTLHSTGQQQQTITMAISPVNEHPYGCQFQLDLEHKNKTGEFSCGIYGHDTYNIVPGDVINMELQPGVKRKGQGGFAFCLKISTTHDSGVTLACNDAITTDRPASTSSTSELPTTTPTSSTSEVPSTAITSTSSTSEIPTTTPTRNTSTSSTSELPSTINPSTSSTNELPTTRKLYGIVGGSVTGVVIIVIIITLVCFIRKRKIKNREKETVNITNTSHSQPGHTDDVQQYETLNNPQADNESEYVELNNITNTNNLQTTSHTDAVQQYETVNYPQADKESVYTELNNIYYNIS
ncbi:uncharacterized protein LOC126827809 [Patella vulgata]|uniref:uncharacterized protein LOC126827809 n=1 Tax=Patella vulgata TaxID=6465 RepID=UPI00217F82E5|nr:uncharacterized protein LOC126827809 [Patella vulgata]